MQIPNKTTVTATIEDVRPMEGPKGPYLSLRVQPVGEYEDQDLWVNLFFSSEKAAEISLEQLDRLGFTGDPSNIEQLFSDLKDTKHEFYVRHDMYKGELKYQVSVSRNGGSESPKGWEEQMRKMLGVKRTIADSFE